MVETDGIEGRLCGELAASIVRHLTKHSQDGPPRRKGATFYHDSMTAFEEATATLTKFGLLAPVPRADKPGETWYCLHALTMDADAMPEFLAGRVRKDDPRFAKMLEAYLGVVCGYGDPPMPTGREPFDCREIHRNAARALAEAGYLEPVGAQYRWTDKIGPTMVAGHFWNEDFKSLAEIEERQLESESDEIVRTMPDEIVEIFKDHADDPLSLTVVLNNLWRDGAWQPDALLPEGGYQWIAPSPGGGIILARRVLTKFKAKYGIGQTHGS
ncbi:hypothetical protein [Bradyrhizobium sp. sGM-13]|uniref:hypothetical protein n=1 Tax=Bradyrhizobium sp. sGM-13 TaxID=2831781 RepID=UPI001BCC7DB7|nr:hypothetical protein [Bradyrhizobium sp. sGM-13]